MAAHVKRRSVTRPSRRAEDFGVRRWLQLGAASAGVSAALFGLSVLGAVGVALADDSDQSSSSSSSSSPSSGSDGTDGGGSSAGGQASSPEPKGSAASVDTEPGGMQPEVEPSSTSTSTFTSTSKSGSGSDRNTSAFHVAPVAAVEPAPPVVKTKTVVAESASAEEVAPAGSSTVATPARLAIPVVAPRQVVADQIEDWTHSSLGWIESLPVTAEWKLHLAGAFWGVRRTLFNLAPTVAPIQLGGQLTGPVTGRVGAVDPEGDWLTYRLVRGPASGSVHVNSDGTYTYTPGPASDGVDGFVIEAHDLGLHLNLLDVFRPRATAADLLVNQGAITFAFDYTTGSDTWTQARRAALMEAVNAVAAYVLVTKPVTLSYVVTGTADPDDDVLASAGSNFVGFGVPDFLRTVVQHELITGVDVNGAAPDGILNWNWGYPWALGDSVSSTEFDFRAIVIHELLHSFGFLSNAGEPATNTGRVWAVYDRFLADAEGVKAIKDDFTWDPDFDGNLTGAKGGLYFTGPHAVAAYGRPVPLYTPRVYTSSAVTHLDDATFTGAGRQLMNAFTGTGPRLRGLSPIELGILRDLGYTVNSDAR